MVNLLSDFLDVVAELGLTKSEGKAESRSRDDQDPDVEVGADGVAIPAPIEGP